MDWSWCVSIEKLKEDIEQLDKLGATHIKIDSGISYDVSYVEIMPISRRVETDEEYAERMELDRKLRDEVKERELAYLERLKKKYENK